MADYDQPLDEYNQALDYAGVNEDDDANNEGYGDGGEPTAEDMALTTAVSLGITEPPSAKTQQLLDQHPEIYPDYEDVIQGLLIAKHKTCPFLTLYERTKVLTLRASQLEHGCPPFIKIEPQMVSVYEIALAELNAKKLPFIIKRPLPNGESEYVRLNDLLIL